jgi:hypothetical protein
MLPPVYLKPACRSYSAFGRGELRDEPVPRMHPQKIVFSAKSQDPRIIGRSNLAALRRGRGRRWLPDIDVVEHVEEFGPELHG